MDRFIDLGLMPLDDFALSTSKVERVAEDERAGVSIAPGYGTFFDEYINMRDPEGSAFTARILEIYDEVQPRQRKRGREALTTRIRGLLANAMRGHFYRQVSTILYFRKADVEWYADKPSWMKHGALGDVVSALADAGVNRRGILTPYRLPTLTP